jgi:1,4-dihydroxy-2-naphthoate octaprenyltransferase
VSILPVLVGSTLPFWLRPAGFVWNTGLFALTLVAVLLIHIASNLANEYHDHRSAADLRSSHRGGLSGGSGLIQAGALPARAFLAGAVVCYAVAACIGIALEVVLPGNVVLVLGILGILGGYFYTAPPLKLSYRGLGEVVVALLFGVLPVVGAYFVQARTVSWQAVVASLPLSFAVVLVLWVNEIADAESDVAAGKLTMAARMGSRAAGRVVVPTLAALAFASLFAAVFTASLIPLTLVSVLAFGLARTIAVDCWSHHARPARLAEAQRAAIKLHLTLGIVIALSALVAVGH